MVDESKKWDRLFFWLIVVGFAIAVVLAGTFFDPKYVEGAGTSQNITTRLNITNTEPIVYQVVLDDLTDTPSGEIVLNAGDVREVYCNASASDPNGQGDLLNATATIYTLGAGYAAVDSKSTHYTNSSCREYVNVLGTTNNRTLTCRFNVEYFAQNTTWECNMTVMDNGGTQLPANRYSVNASGTAQATVNELVAINLSSTILDYGNLSVTETSTEKAINVTNAGNTRTNFTVLGYGGTNQSATGVGNYSMLCQVGNISIDMERFSNVTGASWANMIQLNNTANIVRNVTLLNRTSETDPLAAGSTNVSYWKIKVPLSIGGLCNGTIQFAATAAAS
jgi:hypothetical protein